MNIPKRFLIAALVSTVAAPTFAQNTQQRNTTVRSQGHTTGSRSPVVTQPSNNPFQNPIGQGVPPAASANPNLNSNRTNVPR
jgi:hypothetical protein